MSDVIATQFLVENRPEWLKKNSFVVDSAGNVIHHTALITSDVTLGEFNFIGPHAVLGMPAEDQNRWYQDSAGLTLGSYNVIHGACAIDAGTVRPTRLSNHGFIMKGVHIGHDSQIDDHVILSAKVTLGGHSRVMTMANIGMCAVIHQRHLIGALAWLGMGTVAAKTRDIPPFKIFSGNPGRVIGLYQKGLDRHHMSESHMQVLIAEYEELKQLLNETGFAGSEK